MKKLVVMIFVCALVACGSQQKPKPQPKPEPKPEPQAEVKLDAPLVFETRDGTDLGIPMVEATVRDGSGLFIVNSASTHNVLMRSFATRVRAPMLESRQVGSSGGEDGGVLPVQGVVAYKFAGAELRHEDVISLERPAADAQGIGGYLAPHLVGDENPVIIDYRSKSLKVIEGPDDKVTAWLETNYAGLSDIGSYGQDGRPYAKASVGDKAEVNVMIDTGGPQTHFESAYLAVEGGSSSSPVTFAGTSFPIEIGQVDAVEDDGKTEISGTIGSDILRACTIMFWRSKDRIAIQCG